MRAALTLAALLAAGPVAAHGVGSRALGGGAQAVEFYYASGEPMAYAAVKLYAPADPSVPYVDGRADRLGRFAFLPSEPGSWTVVADDGDGHTLRMAVQAGADAAPASPAPGWSAWRVALWASLSGNALALAAWVNARQRRPQPARA